MARATMDIWLQDDRLVIKFSEVLDKAEFTPDELKEFIAVLEHGLARLEGKIN